MSLIAMQGGATGTGTVTLLAPVTNTNRTLTLPDDTDTVAGIAATQTLTNKTLTSPTIATPTMTGQATIPTINLTGGQITFPATQSASSDANTLDDYEEGTYTITATCGTSGTITLNSSFNTGKYTLVGNTVFFNAHLRVSAISSPVGTVTFSLPFTIASSTNQNRGAGTVWVFDVTATAGDSVVLQTLENTAGVRLATQNAADTYFSDPGTAGMIKATTEMSITGFFYRA